MKIITVALLLVILFTSTLAQMQKIDPVSKRVNTGSDTDFKFHPSQISEMFPEYQRMIINLRNDTTNMLESLGYNVASVKATLKAAVAAKKAIKMCYTNKPSAEFQMCANEEMKKVRLEFETIAPVNQNNFETTGTTKTPIILKVLKLFGDLHFSVGK